jgi:Xaa-Pro aminopeptidase
VPGTIGIRLDDRVVVTDSDPRILTALGKELRIVG